MGSKNLKAIASRGKHRTPIADHEKFRSVSKKAIMYLTEHETFGVGKRFSKSGTMDAIQINDFGIFPTKNWRSGIFNKVQDISYPSMRKRFVIKDTGCLGCPIKCTKITLAQKGPYAGSLSEGPEYETLYSMGSCCEIGYPEAIIAADRLCDDLGIDTMSMGVSTAFAMECFERGLITKREVDELDLKFGSYDSLLKLIEKTAYRSGFGQWVGEGTKKLSEKIGKGSGSFAMHCKGLELGGYDPRGAKGQGLVYAIGSRGGCHHAMGVAARAEMAIGNPYEIKGKGNLVRNGARLRILYDSAMICSFPMWPLEIIAEMLGAITGLEASKEQIELIGDRVITTERMFNVREGLTREDDLLPDRILKEVLPEGYAQGKGLTKEDLEMMKDEFYSSMGWDDKGIPTEACLKNLGL
jgi:aldehyde:ferredoxin oxidoreductase